MFIEYLWALRPRRRTTCHDSISKNIRQVVEHLEVQGRQCRAETPHYHGDRTPGVGVVVGQVPEATTYRHREVFSQGRDGQVDVTEAPRRQGR